MDNKTILFGLVASLFIAFFVYIAFVNKKLIQSGKYDELNRKALKDKHTWKKKGTKNVKKI